MTKLESAPASTHDGQPRAQHAVATKKAKGTRPVWQRPDDQQRHAMIEQLAYSLAERRGFVAGGEIDDWLAAEAEVEQWLQGEAYSGD